MTTKTFLSICLSVCVFALTGCNKLARTSSNNDEQTDTATAAQETITDTNNAQSQGVNSFDDEVLEPESETDQTQSASSSSTKQSTSSQNSAKASSQQASSSRSSLSQSSYSSDNDDDDDADYYDNLRGHSPNDNYLIGFDEDVDDIHDMELYIEDY